MYKLEVECLKIGLRYKDLLLRIVWRLMIRFFFVGEKIFCFKLGFR